MTPNPYESPQHFQPPPAGKRFSIWAGLLFFSTLILIADFVAFVVLLIITPAMLPNPYETQTNVVFVVGATGIAVSLFSVIGVVVRLLTPDQNQVRFVILDKSRTSSAPLYVVVVLLLLPVLYVGSYLATVAPWNGSDTNTFAGETYPIHYCCPVVPPYALRIFFRPIQLVDLRLRPKFWQKPQDDPNFADVSP